MMAKNPLKVHFFLMEVSPESVANQPYSHPCSDSETQVPSISTFSHSLVLGGLVNRASGKGKTTWKRHA